jgi:hypothetical protein
MSYQERATTTLRRGYARCDVKNFVDSSNSVFLEHRAIDNACDPSQNEEVDMDFWLDRWWGGGWDLLALAVGIFRSP